MIGGVPLLLGAALLGACLGSFFNVVVWRVPRGMSVVRPSSHCPACGAPIPFWRNIPVLTWLLQRGRGACCGVRIAPRYVLVEAFAAALSFGWAWAFQAGLWGDDLRAAFSWWVLALLAIPLSLIDWEFFVIPDGLNLVGLAAGLLLRAYFGNPIVGVVVGLRDAALCAGGLYLFAWLLRWGLARWGSCARFLLAERSRRRRFACLGRRGYRVVLANLGRWGGFGDDTEILGMGDVNLFAAGGALIGPAAVLVAAPFAAALGIVGHMVRAALPDSAEMAQDAGVDARAVPFGPFLCGGMLLAQPMLPSLVRLLWRG